MKVKPKKCKGTGKAKGSGCSEVKYIHKYGLCKVCFGKWLFETDNGKEYLNKTKIRAKKIVEKNKKKEIRDKKIKLTNYKKKLQKKINEIVRLIDAGQPCLARGHHAKQMHAGHVYSRGAYPSMRYNLHNIHRQSAQSNHFQNEDGLLREGVVKEYGQRYMDFISELRRTGALKYTNDEYRYIYVKASKIALDLRKNGNVFNKAERIIKRNEINLQLNIYDKEYSIYEYPE